MSNAPDSPAITCMPIMFESQEVRAILDGTKTQTRRVVMPQPFGGHVKADRPPLIVKDGCCNFFNYLLEYRCFYGKVGDTLRPRPDLLIQITAMDVQRVQEISESDARAEGVDQMWSACDAAPGHYPYLERFAAIWDSISRGPGPEYVWVANPWVWVLHFEVVQ